MGTAETNASSHSLGVVSSNEICHGLACWRLPRSASEAHSAPGPTEKQEGLKCEGSAMRSTRPAMP